MNLKIKILVISLFLSVKLFSQEYPKLLIVKQDTLVVFTKYQSVFLAKINEENKINRTIILNQEKQLSLKDSIISIDKKNFNSAMSMSDSYKELIKSKDAIIKAQNSKENIYIKEVKKQKTQKNITIIASCVLMIVSLFIK